MNRASAILCDRCIREKRKPEYTVEWNNDLTSITYHRIVELQDLPTIPKKKFWKRSQALRFWNERLVSWQRIFLIVLIVCVR